MDESTFDHLADPVLQQLEERISEADPDLEASLAQGVLTIQFEDQARFVINSHRAARQIWMAASNQAWHFDWDGTHWISSKSKEELWALVARLLSDKLRRAVTLSG